MRVSGSVANKKSSQQATAGSHFANNQQIMAIRVTHTQSGYNSGNGR